MKIQINGDEWLEAHDVAKMLGIGRESVKNHYRKGRLKGRRLGPRYYFTEGEVAEFMNATKPKKKPRKGNGLVKFSGNFQVPAEDAAYVRAYCKEHGLYIRDVVRLALRSFRAQNPPDSSRVTA